MKLKTELLINETFDVQEDCSMSELERAARTSVALDKLVAQYKLGSLAYYYKGTGNFDNEDAISSIIIGNSLLTANNVPVAGEYEIKNAQSMKIMDSFGARCSFTEYYAMDFIDDVVLMGHDGPGHIAIAQGKTKVIPLGVYHGKVAKGLSVEMPVINGPVTLLSVVEKADGKLMLLVAEAASVAGPLLEIGNTNSRYKFSIGARSFVNKWNSFGPAHHCAIIIGFTNQGVCPVPANGKMYVCVTTDLFKRPHSEVVGAGSGKKIRKREDGKREKTEQGPMVAFKVNSEIETVAPQRFFKDDTTEVERIRPQATVGQTGDCDL